MTSCPVALSVKKRFLMSFVQRTQLTGTFCVRVLLPCSLQSYSSTVGPQLTFLGVEGDCELVDEKGGSERHSDFLVSNPDVSAKCDCMDMCLNVADL